jgi:RHS repeat-associated protein
MTYSFTSKGNLDYRQDNLTGYKETFSYDLMNRLTNWTIYYNNVLQAAKSLAYNSTTGLINSKSDLGSYAMNYGEGGRPPHALTSISGTPSLISSDEQTITYTDFKKVKQITEDNNVVNISYGVDDQRVKSILTQPSGTLTRYYMGNYEEEIRGGNTRKLHYISGGNGLAAIYVQNAGYDTLYYVHTDYQGSIIAVSLPNGTVRERYAYDPWGNRRNPTNWTQHDTRTSFTVVRGFTMHEHLDEFKLVNMGGRVYDPLTSQFLSPDPYIPNLGNSLDFNRYMYARNNPLIYVDPTGEFLGLALRGLSFFAELSSNLIHGKNNPIGSAWKTSGTVTNNFANCAQFPIYQNGNTLITAGLDPFALGVSVNASHKIGDFTVGGSGGYGILQGPIGNIGVSYESGDFAASLGAGVGKNYWGWKASATYKGYGAGYGRTYYGNAIGPDGFPNKQIVGNGTLIWDGGSFTLQNDVGFFGDGKDRWRSNAFELTIGDISIGSYIYTNFGERDGGGIDKSLKSPIWGANRNKDYGAWIDGRVYSAPLWIGVRAGNRMERIGYSFRGIQDLTQNGIHTWFGKQNYYLNYNYFRTGPYLHTGYYNQFSLWGY